MREDERSGIGSVGAESVLGAGGLAKTSPSLWTKLAYGFGAIAYGVKDNGFNYFLLLFYAQVIGLDARLVSLAILIALIADAISDPVVGYWSDNFRSRWGRRHPFMYAAAIPVAVSYYFLWNPPVGWSSQALFWYVLLLAILIRTFITFYETPSTALAPELTENYDERSSLLSFRYYFAWTGGNAMSVINFALIFPAFVTAAIANGSFNRDAYALYGLLSAILIFAAIMVSTLGTHSRIPHLKQPPPKRRLTLGTIFREIGETFASRSFIALFIASIFGFVATGLNAGLAFYFTTYFWGFSPQQIGVVTLCVFISAVLGAVLAPVISRKFGKKRGAITIGLIAFIGSPTPIFLRLMDVLPGNESPFIFWFIVLTTTIDIGLVICYQILAASMVADLVEQAELRTGRRSEGMFYAAYTFMRKCGIGIGIVIAGFVISAVGLAAGAQQGEASDETLWLLGAVYAPAVLALWLTMIAIISQYRIDRTEHEENLRKLAEREAGA
ncbi:MFS transporter [Parasphingopyxis marina]|uniref:MFS transporter n=1 Tax=Parasphingopyxis marina TaxID=2761622 RepID=A0A842I1I4_9SPHN|nr:MFS transporter [Parasphingopyxis marina]MBC2777624.1 MFS transporter [Parasphingopyxis marina]